MQLPDRAPLFVNDELRSCIYIDPLQLRRLDREQYIYISVPAWVSPSWRLTLVWRSLPGGARTRFVRMMPEAYMCRWVCIHRKIHTTSSGVGDEARGAVWPHTFPPRAIL